MIEIMKRELLTLDREIIDNLEYDGTLNTVLMVDKDEYSIEYKISVKYNVRETQYDYDTPPEVTYKRDYSNCQAQIILFDDGQEISKSEWEDLTEFMNSEITQIEL